MPEATLFDAPVARGTHRDADPATSTAAAKATRPALDQQRCYEALVANGGTGTIDTVCSHFADIGVARRRESEPRSPFALDTDAGPSPRPTRPRWGRKTA